MKLKSMKVFLHLLKFYYESNSLQVKYNSLEQTENLKICLFGKFEDFTLNSREFMCIYKII